MFAQALLSLTLIAFVVSTILSAGLLHARMTVHRVAESYLNQGTQRAVDALLGALGNYESARSPQGALPSIAPLPPVCVDNSTPCRFTTEADITFESPAPSYNRQTNPYINEDRVGAQITATVRASDGSPLASRASHLILRVTTSPPYVAIAGARDQTFGNVAPAGQTGDDGGLPPATPNPCSSTTQGTADDTVVRVAYQNAQTGACTDGSIWR